MKLRLNTEMPMVSICTPTFNRRPFIPILAQCIRQQTYPRKRMEWVVVDDGTDSIEDILPKNDPTLPTVRYHRLPEKLPLGKKRNLMHELTQGEILVYMDDDDYYPPERVAHAVETLRLFPNALCVGSSVIHIYFKHLERIIQFGPFGPNHATAGTFAFRRSLLSITRYDDTACLAEEVSFLKGYTIPFAQLNPLKTILVFSHEHNSFDKRRLLGEIQTTRSDTNLKVSDFIRAPQEAPIMRFFMQDIDQILRQYEPGLPIMKQDVLKQAAEIEKKRREMMAAAAAPPNAPNNAPIVLTLTPPQGGQPLHFTMEGVVQLLKRQEELINSLVRQKQQNLQYIQQQAEVIEKLKSGVGAGAPTPTNH